MTRPCYVTAEQAVLLQEQSLGSASSASELSDQGIYELTVASLLSLCLSSQDELLWTEFIRRSQPAIAGVVARTIRRWCRPTPALVDDLVQETYLKLFANNAWALRRFVCRHENGLHGFLKVVASNVVQDHFRCIYSQKRGSGREEESLDQMNGGESGIISGRALKTNGPSASRWAARRAPRRAMTVSQTCEGLEQSILLRQIDAYLKTRASEPTFSRDYSIFWLYYKEGLTAKAIAGLAGIGLTVKGVESTLLRLTKAVRHQMIAKSAAIVES